MKFSPKSPLVSSKHGVENSVGVGVISTETLKVMASPPYVILSGGEHVADQSEPVAIAQDLESGSPTRKNSITTDLQGFLRSIGYKQGWGAPDYEAWCIEAFDLEPWTTLDYDFRTDEWLVKFRVIRNYEIYHEVNYSLGQLLGHKWDKDLHGFRFPADSYNLTEILKRFELELDSIKWAKNRPDSDVMGMRYRYFSNVELTNVAKNISRAKRDMEERWTKLQKEADGASPAGAFSPDFPLMKHQENGEEFVLTHTRCIVADEPGTGKTRIGLDVMYYQFSQGNTKLGIVICPASIKQVWVNQARMFYGEKIIPIRIDGDMPFEHRCNELRAFKPASGAMPLYILGYETARSHPVELQKLCDIGYIVFDECHKMKSPTSLVTKTLLQLDPVGALLATGTPVINYPADGWTIFNYVRPGLLGRTFSEFSDHFQEYDKFRKGYTYRHLDEFNARTKPHYIRRLKKDCFELPEKVYVRDYEDLEITGTQRKAYREMALYFRAQLERMTDKDFTVNAVNQISQLLRLLQICDGFLSEGAGQSEWFSDNIKGKVVRELLGDYAIGDTKTVIWTRFIPPIEMLQSDLAEYHPVVLHGGVPERKRGTGPLDSIDTVVGRFHHDPKCRLLIGQTQTGGVGIDLSCASLCIEYDQWWSPGIMTQAEDRLHRKGQKNPVTIIPLVTSRTIEQFYFADKFDDNGYEKHGVIWHKKQMIETTVEGTNTLIPTREELIDWLGKI